MTRVHCLLLLLIVTVAVAAQQQPQEIAQKAAAEYTAGRFADAAQLYARVVAMLPRSTAARIQWARALIRAGKTDEALAQLGVAVGFGVRFDTADAAWDGVRTDRRFIRLVSRMRARSAPLLRSTRAFVLEKDLIPENIAYDPTTRNFFVGSMYKAKIIRIAPDGAVTDFVTARRDGLLGVVGMKVDAARRDLWAVSGNFGDRPPLQVDDPASVGKGALFRFDADSGKFKRSYFGPAISAEESVQFNDLVVSSAGDVYATAGPQGVWRLRSGAAAVEPFFKKPGAFFNGIAITPDGKTIFAASHFDGPIKIDVATGTSSMLDLAEGVALGGIDGLYVHDNSLVAIQNGTDPIRVIRAWLNPEMTRVTRFAVLEQEHPDSDIPLTGTIVGDELYYVARSQLRAFEGKNIWPAERLKDTIILKLPLETAAAPAPDLAAERAALLKIHRDEIRAHIELDARALAENHGDDFVSATRGKINRATSADTLKFFTRYFKGAKYPLYEDADEPVVRVSDDASMGWILSRTRVRRVEADGKEEAFVYAGIMAYEKRNGRWIRVGNASTFE